MNEPLKLWELVQRDDWMMAHGDWLRSIVRKRHLLSVDPGTTHSAYVVLHDGQPLSCDKVANEDMLQVIKRSTLPLVVEHVASYGKPVGVETFDTVLWYGRFIQAHIDSTNLPVMLLRRPDVKLQLCFTTRGVTDAVIRQRMLDKFGGKAAIGTKKQPGVLYDFTRDTWQALAVGVATLEIIDGTGRRFATSKRRA